MIPDLCSCLLLLVLRGVDSGNHASAKCDRRGESRYARCHSVAVPVGMPRRLGTLSITAPSSKILCDTTTLLPASRVSPEVT